MLETTTNGSGGTTAEAAKEATAQAAGVASTAAEQTTAVAGTAVEGGKWVAAVGQEQARTVASTAGEQVAQVAGEVGAQARNLVDESKQQLRSQAQGQTDQIASKLRELGDQVQALVDGRTDEAGAVGDYARHAAETVSRVAGRIESRGFDGVVEDVQRFARRKPGTFLVGAALAGLGVGRLLRAGAVNQSSGQAHPKTQVPPAGPHGYVGSRAYDEIGMSTQPPPLVDVTDASVTATSAVATMPATDPAGVPVVTPAAPPMPSPMSDPTNPGYVG